MAFGVLIHYEPSVSGRLIIYFSYFFFFFVLTSHLALISA